MPSSKENPVSTRPSFFALLGRLRTDSRQLNGLLYLAVVVATLLATALPNAEESPLAAAERFAFDAQMQVLRAFWPRPLEADVVLVGIDEDTEAVFTEPVALWHRHFARLLTAIAAGSPKAIGFDVVPPERSYDDILPGSDLALFRAIREARKAAVTIFALTVDRDGRPVPMHPTFARVLGEAGLGLDQQLKDPDSVNRRFSEIELGESQPVRTLVGQLLRGAGMAVQEGYIDYSIGSTVAYLPMQDLIAWHEAGRSDRLETALRGRIVLVGYLNKRADRWDLPVELLPNDRAKGKSRLSQPGVVTHLQALRSHLASGLLKPAPESLRWLLVLAAAASVFLRAGFARTALLAAVLLLLTAAAGLGAIRGQQIVLPVATTTFAIATAFLLRAIVDAVESAIERGRLRRTFAGQVSPAVMSEMLAGGLATGVNGRLAEICVLFSDIRGFTTLSERMPPVIVTTVLQRYFDRMVRAVHRHEGTVDKFIGDGMMVLFGAPRPSTDPCGDAVSCALAMMSELDELNAEFSREGLPTLTIGIGINFGPVTVGNIGSSERHNYSAIGDAVNVAARVEGLTKDLGRKIVITDSVVERIGDRFRFEPLGLHELKGHTPVAVWGIRTTVPPAQDTKGSP